MQVGMRDVDAVIFDFDGTLADSMWVWDEVDRAFLAKRGIPFTDEFGEMIAVLGFELGADFAIEHFGLDESPESIIEEWKSLAEESYATHVMLKPGAFEYLRHCKEQGMPLAIATSLQRHLLEPALANNGVLDLFDAICVWRRAAMRRQVESGRIPRGGTPARCSRRTMRHLRGCRHGSSIGQGDRCLRHRCLR